MARCSRQIFPQIPIGFITDSMSKGQKMLFCSSSRNTPTPKNKRSYCLFRPMKIEVWKSQCTTRNYSRTAVPCPPFWNEWRRWMMYRDFKSAGVRTGKFVQCVWRQCVGTWFAEEKKMNARVQETRVLEWINFSWMNNVVLLNEYKFLEWTKVCWMNIVFNYWIHIKFLNE